MEEYSNIKIPSNRTCCLYNEVFQHSEKGDIYEFDSIGFRIWHFSSNQEFQGRVAIPLSKDFILMCFCLNKKGDLQYGTQQRIEFAEEQHNLIFMANSESAHFSIPKNENAEVFAILLQADIFFSYFPVNSSDLFIKFKQQVKKKKEAVILSSENFPINLAMKSVIHNMMSSTRDDECKHIYFKAKIIELLSLQLEQFMTMDTNHGKSKSLTREELDRIHEVKRTLEDSPEKAYTLLGLARSVGTNDATLKKHFKMTFGTTVFSYLNRCRMEKAHLMLHQEDFKVSHVAEEVGFKYSSHFSAAFKKHFGYSPAELKNADKATARSI